MNKWNTILSEVKTEINRLQIENKLLALKNFELLSKYTILTGNYNELKKKYEASQEINKRLLETNMDITNKLIKL